MQGLYFVDYLCTPTSPLDTQVGSLFTPAFQ